MIFRMERMPGSGAGRTGGEVVVLAVLGVWLMNQRLPGAAVDATALAACTAYRQPGDINLGALLSLHGSSAALCDTPLIPRGVVHAEALAWAVRDVNGRTDLLPNLTLGFDIRDDCRDENVALWMTLDMLGSATPDAFRSACPPSPGSPSSSSSPTNRSTANQPSDREIVGIIGTSRSTTSIPVSQLTGLFQMPLISFWASSNELSDKGRFPYFLRTVPPDRHQISAIVDVLLRFGWTYVSLIHSGDSYGLHGGRELVRLAELEGICLAFVAAVNQSPTEAELDRVVGKLVANPSAKVVVMFAALQVANAVLDRVGSSVPDLGVTWIGGDDWGFDLTERGLGEVAKGSLFTRFFSQTVPSFEAHFLDLSSSSPEGVSPWYAEYTRCATAEDGGDCQGGFHANASSNYVVSPVADGVYVFAHALDSLLAEVCPARTNCPAFKATTKEALLAHLSEVSFVGTGGSYFFDEYGDPPGKYILTNYQRTESGEYASVHVGLWDSQSPTSRLEIRADEIRWHGGPGDVPRSTCVPDCQPGHALVPSERKCCWECQACLPHEIVANGSGPCSPCDSVSWPADDRARCRPITPDSLSWRDPIVVAILLSSGTGLLLTSLTVAGMVRHRRHPLIKAASRELSGLVLFGVALAFSAVLLLLARPSALTCPASEATISLSVSLTYAPTLLKVNRIYRIFKAGKVSARRPNWVSPRKLIVTASVLILIQVLIIVVSVAVSPVRAQISDPMMRTGRLELYCAFSYEFLPSCAYNLVLILVCCRFAFRARQVPDHYNESRFIAVSVYSTLVVCLASFPVYLTAAAVVHKVATLAAAVLLNAYLTLACVYLPKLYAVSVLAAAATADQRRGSGGGSSAPTVASPTVAAPTVAAGLPQPMGERSYSTTVGRIHPL